MKSIIEYEGKAKKIVSTDDPMQVIQLFKDDATAFNGQKKESFKGKGALNNAMSCHFFKRLEQAQIPTHFIKQVDATQMLVKRLKIVPIEFVVRNRVSGSLQKRTGLEEGSALGYPIVETYYKSDALGDPLLADVHIELLELVTMQQLSELKAMALEVNRVLAPWFKAKDLYLVDIKFEFGYDADGQLCLGDEISPDVCRLWDMKTYEKFDKDVFRKDLRPLMEAYQELAKRLELDNFDASLPST